MENNQQQYLNPETYIGVIQDLSATMANLQVELALAKTQNKEILAYVKELQAKLEETENAEVPKIEAEVVDTHE